MGSSWLPEPMDDEPRYALRQREMDRLLEKARQEALEEAARVAEKADDELLEGHEIAAAIRALKCPRNTR